MVNYTINLKTKMLDASNALRKTKNMNKDFVLSAKITNHKSTFSTKAIKLSKEDLLDFVDGYKQTLKVNLLEKGKQYSIQDIVEKLEATNIYFTTKVILTGYLVQRYI